MISALLGLFLPLACTGDPGKSGEDTVCETTTWSLDVDGDGWAGVEVVEACEAPAQASDLLGDCDDSQVTVYPTADEVCDGLDNDCDGVVDPDAPIWYADADDDGFGDAAVWLAACEAPAGYVADDTDCDDDDSSAYPGAHETWYDGVDQDCGEDSDFDADADGADADTWGGLDCNDADRAVGPHVEEVCHDGIDNDCAGEDGDCQLGSALTFEDADVVIEGDVEYQYLSPTLEILGGVTGEGVTLAVAYIDYFGGLGGDRVVLYEYESGGLLSVASVATEEPFQGLGATVQPSMKPPTTTGMVRPTWR